MKKIHKNEIPDWKQAFLAALTGYAARPAVEPQTVIDRAMDAADGYVLNSRVLSERILLDED